MKWRWKISLNVAMETGLKFKRPSAKGGCLLGHDTHNGESVAIKKMHKIF